MRIRLMAAAALVVTAGLVVGVFVPSTGRAFADTFFRSTPAVVPIASPHFIHGAFGAYTGKCVDVPGGIPADGAQLQIWDCNGTPAQIWTSGPQGQAMALGMCMDVAWGSTDNGARVQLARCYPNDPAQQWIVDLSGGNMVNPHSNKCLDIRDWQTYNGAPLETWDCTGGANQKWRLSFP